MVEDDGRIDESGTIARRGIANKIILNYYHKLKGWE